MTQYMLSVHDVVDADDAPTDPAELQKIYDDVDVFNEKVRAAGAWVFAGGLMPIDATTVRRQHDRPEPGDRRAVRGVEGVPRRLLGHRGARPRRSPEVGRGGLEGLRRQGRGPTVPGRRDRLDVDASCRRRSSASSARSTRGSSRRWPAASVISTSPRRRPARQWSSRWRSGRSTGCPRIPGAGSPPPPATRPSTGSAARDDATTSTDRPPWKPNAAGTTTPPQPSTPERSRTTASGWCSPAATRPWPPRPGSPSPCGSSPG